MLPPLAVNVTLTQEAPPKRDSLLKSLFAFLRRPPVLVGLAVVACAAGAALKFGYVDLNTNPDASGERGMPNEYLYLDDERVDAYYGQMENGIAKEERRMSSSSRRVEARGTAVDLFEVGGSAQDDEVVERVVTPLAADRFFALQRRIDGEDDAPRLDADEPITRESLDQVDLGDFVTISNARLQLPSYALTLPKTANATPQRVDGQEPIRREPLSDLLLTHPRAVNDYLRDLGPDPRIPAVVKAQGDEGRNGKREKVTVLVPLRYSKLADAPSLLSGKITVVGKVIRRVSALSYFDVERERTFAEALAGASGPVLRAMRIERDSVRPTIRRTATIPAPALMVIPVAIFH